MRLILCIILLVQASLSMAQIGGSRGGSEFASSNNRSQLPTDSIDKPELKYQYFSIENIHRLKTYSDTSLSENFWNYDPIRFPDAPYVNLGNNGSAHQMLKYESRVAREIDFGFHQYDLYKYRLEDLKFYTVNRPISDLFFSNQGGRQNFFVSSEFSRSFSEGIQINLQYRRILQEGLYQAQNVKHTNLGLSLWYQSPSKRYDIITAFTNNVETSTHNGGIPDTTDLFDQNLLLRRNTPVALSNANTRHQQRAIHVLQYYNLASSSNGFALKAHHHLSYDAGYFRYYDFEVGDSNAEAFYGDFIVDDRGLRYDLGYSRLTNKFSLQGVNESDLKIDIGIKYDYSSLNYNPSSETLQDLFLIGEAAIPYKGQELNTDVWLGLGDAAGTFKLGGDLNLSIDSLINLSAGASIYRYRQSILSNTLNVSELTIWSNDWEKRFGTEVSASLDIPKFNLEASLKQTIDNNALYYDRDARPQLLDDVYTATVLDVKHSLRLGAVGFENYVMAQAFSDNIYHLPAIVTRHNLFVETRLFKKNMLARVGVEGIMVPTYDANAFMPLTGQFYQSDFETTFYPHTDLYITTKVSSLRTFLRFENFTDYFTDDIPFYVVGHPQNDVRFRFGVRWLLMD